MEHQPKEVKGRETKRKYYLH